MSLYLGNNLISGVVTPIEPTRNIGQIIQSTLPLNDAGLHLLDGSVIQGNGIYSDFYDYMIQIYNNYPHLFCTETEWQQYVSTDGACNRFVLDTTNKTIRLGLLTGFIEGTNSLSDLGALTAAGLPNITGTFQDGNEYGSTDQMSGAFYRTNIWGHTPYSGNGSPNRAGFDASRSNPIYGRSSTVQPQSIKVLYYIVIATSVKTDIQVDIDKVVTDLNGKVNKDLSNCTKPYVTETYVNGTSWYRVYSDGWCEQGGQTTTQSQTVTFLKQFRSTPTMTWGFVTTRGAASYDGEIFFRSVTASNFVSGSRLVDAISPGVMWEAKGYIN